ncbi:MAG TPA: CheR family methyltransferase [Thermoanaerobaculia bacterium]|nr:CheR family methyltransferase [Thermoanaerobaculia bacterium]
MSDTTAEPVPATTDEHPGLVVVGLGGSAGSIPAFREFFRHVPADSEMAYVVVVHLSPEHESRLADVLQGSTTLPVTQVLDAVKVEPNRVYVIPPNKSLAMSDGTLLVSDVTGFAERRAPIDIFFRTLADTHDARAVCVVLSGSGSDGSMGLRRIKENNGLAIVQEPTEAQFDGMPRSSIATGLVDFILPVADMPSRVIAYRDQLRASPLARSEPLGGDEQALIDIFTFLRVRTGHDFTNYKRPTILRRIERRLAVREIPRLSDYANFLRNQPEEAEALLRELLISVTNFFRDREVWDRVEETIVPRLFAGKGSDDYVRVWVAGCATGEEAYTVAMILADAAMELASPPEIQIFASDLDEQAIAKARNGFYTAAETADVSPERLRRHFVPDHDGFRIRRELRELVLFANHNLIKDPPFSHVDFVTCRNVLIYLNRSAQERAMAVLHFALEPGGYLLLGTAETVDGAMQLFSTIDKAHHIYESRAVPRLVAVTSGARATVAADLRTATPVHDARGGGRHRFGPIELHQRLLEHYAPPSLIVDDQYNIVHVSEHAVRYVQFAPGEPSINLLQVALPELRIPLRTALFQAEQKHTTVVVHAADHQHGDSSAALTLIVRPEQRAGDPARGYFLVLFDETTEGGGVLPRAAASPAEPPAPHLEEEVVRLRSQMRATVEQYEVQAEEARAANEELQAINEELRSTAEELETSQEELQSLNEELQTVNQELKIKIDEVSHANSDMRNLMSSTEIGTIFVDRGLRVRLFTPRIRDVFNLIAGDVGRPLLDISSRLKIDNLAGDVEAVMERLQTIEREVQTHDGRWHLMRLLPYRTADDHIDGTVLTFVDVTDRKRADDALRLTEDRNRIIVESARDYVIITTDTEGLITSWSPGAETAFGWTASDVIGQSLAITFSAEDRADGVPETERKTAREHDAAPDVRWHVRKDGARVFIDGTTRVLRGLGGEVRGFLKIGQDVTERRRTEMALRDSEGRLQTIADLVPDLLWSHDVAGEADWYNQRWLEYPGQTFEKAGGRGWLTAIHPEDREMSRVSFLTAIKAGVPLRHERRIRSAAGTYRWFLVQSGPLRDANGEIIRWFGAATDIHQERVARDVLEERVRERTQQLEELSGQRQQLLERLVMATEEERRRIARELHDELGQHITALRVGLDQPEAQSLQRMQSIVQRLDETVDRLTLELRTPVLDHIGLHGAITTLAEAYALSSGIRIDVHLPAVEDERFSDAIETTLYRVAQEALTNVLKHAEATTASIILEREGDTLRMIVEDDGHGFDADGALAGTAARGRFGLIGMRERLALVGGSLTIEAASGSGTAIYARVPLKNPS